VSRVVVAESSWAKWTRNGRLSAIAWTITFGVWIGFKLTKIPLEGLDTVFILMSSVLAANLGITVVRPGQKDPPPTEKAE
jgi:hypothetical protein